MAETENVNLEELEDPTGLFTDGADGEAPMLPGNEYDGAEPAAAPAPEAVEAKGEKLLRIDLGNGHAIVGKTRDELLEKAVKMKIDTDKALADREDQIRVLKAQPAPQPRTEPQRIATEPVTDGEWDAQKYLNLLGEDPMKARRYQDQFYDGAKDSRVEYAYNVAQKVEQQLTASEFLRRNPDYVPSDDAADKIHKTMKAHGLPTTLVNMEWAYGELKRSGQVAAAPSADGIEYEDVVFGAPEPKPTRPASRGAGAAPTLKRGGKAPEGDAVNAETMPLEDLRNVLRKAGALQ